MAHSQNSRSGLAHTSNRRFADLFKGLMDAEERHGFEGEGFAYLKNPIWWAGIIACKVPLWRFAWALLIEDTVIVGEIANFAAYAFAPAILVTPLGCLSVLIGAVLGSYFLKEQLGTLGKLGCAICLIGSVMIVLHAPPDKDIQTIDEILHYAIQPGMVSLSVVLLYTDRVLKDFSYSALPWPSLPWS